MTELENKFIKEFKKIAQDFGDCFEEVTTYILPIISEEMNLSINQVKGIIGSLVNKQILIISEVNGENSIIYFEEE